VQTKLAIGSPGDRHEHEADRVAAQVMRMPEPSVLRHSAASAAPASAPAGVHETLRSPGNPLESSARAFMEQRFGHDFSRVRVHADESSAESASSIQARAYTTGGHIVFGRGEYSPHTPSGRGLIAHELAHVVQQAAGGDPGTVRRVPMAVVKRDAPNAKTWSGAPARCGPDFCRPLPSEGMAIDERTRWWPIFSIGIAAAVDSRVVPLWSDWAFGGSSTKDLTKDFGSDFTNSPTTADTTRFLMKEIKAKLTASPPALPAAGIVTLDIASLIPAAVKAIDDPAGPDQMNFNIPGDIPGNLAGGIGKDEKANPIGARPSPQDDARIVQGDLTITSAGASLLVVPRLTYTVKDTIDLCPGDCGTKKEQIATVPMSMWEATGISGDVPFTVDFPPPVPLTVPFLIPKPAAPAPAPAPSPAPAPAPKKP
jgi:hypothetical protein